MKNLTMLVLVLLMVSGFVFADSISVVSPNGGEGLVPGGSTTITWNAAGTTNSFKISLMKNGSVVGIIATDIAPGNGNRSYPWTIGQYTGGNVAGGTGFKVKVKEIGMANSDKSDGEFDIVVLKKLKLKPGALGGNKKPHLKPGALAGITEIKVTKPSTNALVDCGSQYTIKWETPVKQAFKIELWKYNEKTKYADIATMLLIPGKDYDGKYSFKWNIPHNHPNAPGKRTIKITSANGVFKGFSKPFNFRTVGAIQEKTVTLNPDSMKRRVHKKRVKYDTSGGDLGLDPETMGLGNEDNQLRVGYWTRYVTGVAGRWWWWTMVFRSSVHYDLSQYTGDKIFLVKATLKLKKKKTVSTLSSNQNHAAKGFWQLTAPWSPFYNPACVHMLDVGQMGGTWYLDVTSKVREWVQGQRDNDGFLLTGFHENLTDKVTEHCVSFFEATLELRYIDK